MSFLSKCSICNSDNFRVMTVDYPFINHTDYSNTSQNGTLGQCNDCSLIFQVMDDDKETLVSEQFESGEYSESLQTSHKITVREFEGQVTRTFLQANILKNLIDDSNSRILDIGCYDGVLLKELRAILPTAELHGYDAYEGVRHLFPKGPGFHFCSGDIRQIDGQFDLIIMSHSIAYERDINNLLTQLVRLLKKDGTLFFQMPDVQFSPWYLLMSDQYHHYTPSILKNILTRFGFEFRSYDTSWFPREVVGVAKNSKSNFLIQSIDAVKLEDCIGMLDQMASKLRAINSTDIGVLGTTGAAAFADNICSERVGYYVDENMMKTMHSFRGKPVVHPEILVNDDIVVLPYGFSSEAIRERLERNWSGKFVAL